jgi:hypothetical protein
MKRILLLPLFAALAVFVSSCGKQPTEAERNAEIERQVQQRLDAEHQADEQQKLAQRQAELDAREQALAAKENRPVATAAPAAAQSSSARTAVAGDSDNSSYSTFYRKLDPYGDWMETSDYGYVFQPRQAAQSRDWRPYTNGHWVYTDAGWTWISDEQFGWATYHYGRWIRLHSVGWVGVPGEQWAPAWVSWRKGNDHVGWAPLPPEARFDRQTGIRNWADNYYDIGPEQYAFVPANEFGGQMSVRAIVPPERNVTIINQTTNVTNITYSNSLIVDRGPSFDDLRARSRQPIERLRLERTQNFNDERPVIRGEVVARNIAQPEVERGWAGIQDAQAAQKARAKMEAEATPPPNLPPQRFVRPGNKTTPPARPGPAQVGRTVSPSVSAATAIPVGTPARLPSNPPPPPASPQRGRPGARAQPAAQPIQPSPAQDVSSPNEADRDRREIARAAQEAKQQQRQQEQAQRRAEREQKMLERRGDQPLPTAPAAAKQPAATPALSAVETPSAASPNDDTAGQRQEKRAGKKQRKSKGTPGPDTSPSPGAHQP